MKPNILSCKLLAGGLLFCMGFVALADQVNMKDGRIFVGTVEYQDADIIKFTLAGTGDIQVFFTQDVDQVTIGTASAGQPSVPATETQPLQEAEWERKGYDDGASGGALKTTLAGLGGCLLGAVGGGVFGPPTALTAGGGGAAGCLGGWGTGHLGQMSASPPATDLVAREAYMRGYRHGVSRSNVMALLVGGGTTVLAIVLTAYLVSSSY